MPDMAYVADDGGRGPHGGATDADCAVRALAIASGAPYRTCFDVLDRHNQALGEAPGLPRGTAVAAVEQAYPLFGFHPLTLRRRLPLTTVARCYPRAIVLMRRHLAAIVDGALRDEGDSRHMARTARRVWVHRAGGRRAS